MILILTVVLLNFLAAEELFPETLQLSIETPKGLLELTMHETTNENDIDNLDMKVYEYEDSSVAMFYTYHNNEPTTYYFGTLNMEKELYMLVPQIFSEVVPSDPELFTTTIRGTSYFLIDPSDSHDYEKLMNKVAQRMVVIDVAIVVDYSVYKWFNESRGGVVNDARIDVFYSSVAIVEEMEKIFKRMEDSKFNFKLQLVDLKILNKPETLLTEEEDLDYKETLKALPNLLDNNVPIKIVDHDALFLFTMHPPKSGLGAEVCESCGDVSTAVVWSRGVHGSAQRAARALALSYGVPMDTGECEGLMSDNFFENILHKASFSKCSSTAIHQYFISTVKGKHRFSRFHTSKEKGSHHRRYNLGSRFSADEQCKQIFGSKSFYCTGGEGENKEICQMLLCYDSKRRNCVFTSETVTLKGTRCGASSHCMDTQCVPASNLSPNNCLYGDSVFFESRSAYSQLCSSIKSTFTFKSCVLQEVKDVCCRSCP